MKNTLLLILSFFIVIPLRGQQVDQKLTLEKIYKERILRSKGIVDIQWQNDGNGYTVLEHNDADGGEDIVSYKVKTGERNILVASKDLIPKETGMPLDISEYQWSGQGDKLLIFTNTKRVWRYKTRGDYWVYNSSNRNLQKLGKGLEESSLMFAKFSPDGLKVAYVSNRNIYIENIADGKTLQLTNDGGPHTINGTFDWVYEEEFDCRDGFRWSPDGSKIAYWQSDTEGIGTYYLINNIDSVYPKLITIPYPKAGTTNPAVKVGIVPSSGGATQWFDIPGDPRNNYIPRMEFIPETDQLMIQQLDRQQNSDKVWIADAGNLKLNNIFTEKDEAFLDTHDCIIWLQDNHYFTWMSERDGWLHLYQVSADGKSFKLLTPGDFDVIDVSSIDEESGFIYFIASPHNFTQRYLYRVNMKKPGEPELVSPPEMQGQHGYNVSPGARWAIHTFNNHVTPAQYSLISLPRHEVVRVLEDNALVKSQFDNLKLSPKEFFKVNTGVAELDGWMIKPPSFDPGKKYPVIFFVYGEPASSTVQDSWEGGDLWHEYLSQLGYIVMSIDNRGTNVPRGREWRKSIYKKMGVISSADQAAAVLEIEKTYPFVDPARIGIWGWSGGGSSTLNAMFRYPDIYSAGIAVAFVANLKLYDTIYQERYTGIPSQDDEAYEKGSPINFAQNLRGKLLLIHGTGDDNVHYQNCEMLVNELIKDNKVFEMMSYPMRSHGIYEGANTSLHLRKTMEKFWLENLPVNP